MQYLSSRLKSYLKFCDKTHVSKGKYGWNTLGQNFDWFTPVTPAGLVKSWVECGRVVWMNSALNDIVSYLLNNTDDD